MNDDTTSHRPSRSEVAAYSTLALGIGLVLVVLYVEATQARTTLSDVVALVGVGLLILGVCLIIRVALRR